LGLVAGGEAAPGDGDAATTDGGGPVPRGPGVATRRTAGGGGPAPPGGQPVEALCSVPLVAMQAALQEDWICASVLRAWVR
jgi:hypothetical protein